MYLSSSNGSESKYLSWSCLQRTAVSFQEQAREASIHMRIQAFKFSDRQGWRSSPLTSLFSGLRTCLVGKPSLLVYLTLRVRPSNRDQNTAVGLWEWNTCLQIWCCHLLAGRPEASYLTSLSWGLCFFLFCFVLFFHLKSRVCCERKH